MSVRATQSREACIVNPELFGAHGEMSALLRAFDWSRSALGSPDVWPTSLRTITGVVLGSRFPMMIWWGRDLIQIYNDGYRPILGDKHPRSMASPGISRCRYSEQTPPERLRTQISSTPSREELAIE